MQATLADLHELTAHLYALRTLQTQSLWALVDGQAIPADAGREVVLAALLEGGGDLVVGDLPPAGGAVGRVFYLSTLADPAAVDQSLIGGLSPQTPAGQMARCQAVGTYGDAVRRVLAGSVLVLADGQIGGLAIEARGYKTRAITQPVLETVVRGPHEAFIEDLPVNLSLLRRRLPDPGLVMEPFVLGRQTRTQVRLVYLAGRANEAIVAEVHRRLLAIDAVAIGNTCVIEEAIADDPYSIFPTLDFSERPDVVSAALLDGCCAIFVDGDNNALIAPVTFWSMLQSPDDYTQRFYAATFLRWLRYFFLGIALQMPALYIALTTFDPEMLPVALLQEIHRSQLGFPFPAAVEAFIMELAIEILREAGMRLPGKLSTSLGVVGALIIGSAVVRAGLVPWPMVAVVAITAVANFAIPRWEMALAIRLLCFVQMIAAAVFGLPGILVATTCMLIHVVSLRSFGVPYFYPVASFDGSGMLDVALRLPQWIPKRQPHMLMARWRAQARAGQPPRPFAAAGRTGANRA